MNLLNQLGKYGEHALRVYTSGVKSTIIRLDGWANNLTGLGTRRDKQEFGHFHAARNITDQEAANLYVGDDLAARVCDAMPEYALKKGLKVKVRPAKFDTGVDISDEIRKSEEAEKLMRDELKRLKAVPKLIEALAWANVYGAAALMVGANDGAIGPNLALPLEDFDEVSNLIVLEKPNFYPAKWYEDRANPKFGEPMTYWIVSTGTDMAYELHESRLILIGGVRTPLNKKRANGGFDDSLLNRGLKVLRQFGMSWLTLTHLIEDANQGVFKMRGLIDALAADEEELIQKRMELLDSTRSAVKSLVLDSDGEEFHRENFNWGGINAPFDLLMYRVSAAFKCPVTIIMGRSPAGMNATGDSDWTNWDSDVEQYRQYKIEPAAYQLMKFIFAAKSGPFKGVEPDNWEVELLPLRTVTPMEAADIYVKNSQGDSANITAGVLTADEVAIARFGPDSGSDISIDISTRTNFDPQAEKEAEREYQKDLLESKQNEKLQQNGDNGAGEADTEVEDKSAAREKGAVPSRG